MTADPATPAGPAADPARVAELGRRAKVLWVAPAGAGAPQLVWQVWHDGAAHVLHSDSTPTPSTSIRAAGFDAPAEPTTPGLTTTTTGEAREQSVPGLAAASLATVVFRTATAVVRWQATASRVEPGSSRWSELEPLLLKARGHLPDRDGAGRRWAATCVLTRLDPVAED